MESVIHCQSQCLVEDLAREHAILAEQVFAIPVSDEASKVDRANARMNAIEDAAVHLQARSPGGALFQTVLLVSLFERFVEQVPDVCDNIDLFRDARSAAASIVAYLEKLAGEDRAAFSGEYVAGLTIVARQADDKKGGQGEEGDS